MSAEPIDHLVGHGLCDIQTLSAREVKLPDRPARGWSTPRNPALADQGLTLAAEVLDDLEKVRIANQNRLRQMTRDVTDKDGVERGFGLTEDHPDVARLAGIVDGLAKLEHQSTLALQRRMREHPLGAWVKRTKGIGEKQAARLLAAINDPHWNTLHDRPRTVSELWAYCGLHTLPLGHTSGVTHAAITEGAQSTGGDPDHPATDAQMSHVRIAARRKKGQRSNWSAVAKMRAYLIAESCVKQRESPYRAVYDARRATTKASHPEWTDGHSHNDALRIVSKAVLKDLWREARDLTYTEGD